MARARIAGGLVGNHPGLPGESKRSGAVLPPHRDGPRERSADSNPSRAATSTRHLAAPNG